ncbi:putative molluscan insulin-related peptide(s) receptor [Pararge aegeria]|uniref:putative molluscan insulin-related peptide(s) receptor n=1 Tax=Pararge aegeria TaxID=116150 RepID=UPI0019D0F59F|nr:putative molluscan insulin-related peptide(s) receptor [Pararge aegeria]
MAKTTLIWLIGITISFSCVATFEPREHNGFCIDMNIHRKALLSKLENCTVVIGDLIISPLERTKPQDFKNVLFPKLKEVTGFMVVYRVFGLETLGNLFPNLARIRGNTVLYNYALVVYDMSGLREVGLHNLLKIDRGGVIIWGNPLTCFADTIDWNAIAPSSRHVLRIPDREARCNFQCTCSDIPSRNRCWNNRKCQRFLEGPEGENCSSECLGCRNTNHSSCSLCRNYTFRGECVPRCPDDTYILSASNYCLTKAECLNLKHWIFDNKCVSECPINYKKEKHNSTVVCVYCKDCQKICQNLSIQDLSTIQLAEKCVYIQGYLKIHIWSLPQVVEELSYYLKNIKEVSKYVLIYNSMQLTSLHFLSSLKRIRGEELYNGSYSLLIYGMQNLQSLFLPNVTQNLKVDKGFLGMYRNRMLCMSEIEKLKTTFEVAPREIDVPPGLNGYSAGCDEVYPNLKIEVQNETFAIATFYPVPQDDIHYALLYVIIPHGSHSSMIPESCSDSEWFSVNIPNTTGGTVKVELSSLRPATTYAVCIEKYDSTSRHLARSNITNFTTAVGKPEPPFILELVASSFNIIVIRWVNHLDYRPYITKYELDVTLVDIEDHDITVRDHCVWMDDDLFEIDYSRHAKVMRPPNNYEKGCESMCGVLSSVTKGAMVEDFFDVCSAINGCDHEIERPKNSSSRGVVKNLSLDLEGDRNNSYQIGGLLPYRDYRFYLRACTKDRCSTSARGIVRTLRLESADIASITFASANKSGFIDIKWDPPTRTNGPLLSNTLEVLHSDAQIYDINHLLPKTWCVPGNITSIQIKSNVAEKYLIRICSTTLGNAYICNDWKKVVVQTEYEFVWWWSALFFGIILPIFSCILAWRYSVKVEDTENIPLVDITSTLRQEAEAPASMFSDFMPSNYISLSDLHFE